MTRLIAQFGLIVGSAMLGLAVMTATWTFLRVVMYPKSRWTVADTFEMDRLSQLRVGSKVFSWFEAIVRELLSLPGLRDRKLQKLDRQLRLAQEAVPWKATEFLATKRVESLLVALAVFTLVAMTGFIGFAAILAIVMLFSYSAIARRSIESPRSSI